jgi:B-box zinc finger
MTTETSGFLATTCTAVSRASDDWDRVEWLLHATFRTSTISLRSVWTVSHPGLLNQFRRRSDLLASNLSVVIADELNIPIRQICERGFTHGPMVKVGNQILPGAYVDTKIAHYPVRRRGAGRRLFEAIVLEVAPGLAQLVDSAKVANVHDMGPDYDSFLIKEINEPEQATIIDNQIRFLPPNAFTHTYLLREATQALPLFVCRFEVDNESDEDVALPVCNSCEQAAATVWCPADEAALCGSCDAREHAPENKIMSKHVRIPINDRYPPEAKCQIVPSEPAMWWDPEMHLAVSEKAVKEHLTPSDRLKKFQEAYKSSVKIARREDPVTAKTKGDLLALLTSHEDAINATEREIRNALDYAYAGVQSALQRVSSLSEQKSKSILDSQRSLSKRLEFVQWAQTLLTPYSDSLTPTEWLHLWMNHRRLVQATLNDPSFFENEEIDFASLESLMSLRGSLKVNS